MLKIDQNFINLVKYSYFDYSLKLSFRERLSLMNYSLQSYETVNKSLRCHNIKDCDKSISLLDSSLDKFNYDTHLTVYRYEEQSFSRFQSTIDKLDKGIFTEDSYISTSVKRNFGWQYNKPNRSYRLTYYKIDIPSTLCGAYISPISLFGIFEQEFLIKRGSIFEVEDYSINTNNDLINAKLKVKM